MAKLEVQSEIAVQNFLCKLSLSLATCKHDNNYICADLVLQNLDVYLLKHWQLNQLYLFSVHWVVLPTCTQLKFNITVTGL